MNPNTIQAIERVIGKDGLKPGRGRTYVLGGPRGVGKTTFLLQLGDAYAKKYKTRALFLCGEMSTDAIHHYAKRVIADSSRVVVCGYPNGIVDVDVPSLLDETGSGILLVDSLRVCRTAGSRAKLGSAMQVSACASFFQNITEHYRIATVLITHLNEDGSSPLDEKNQHRVDCGLRLDRSGEDILLRVDDPLKNRFASVDATCRLRITERGFEAIPETLKKELRERLAQERKEQEQDDKRCFGAYALSPWWGTVELVDVPVPNSGGNIECWNGDHIAYLVAETLRPLSPLAAAMLGRKFGDVVWDDAQVRRWENEPLRIIGHAWKPFESVLDEIRLHELMRQILGVSHDWVMSFTAGFEGYYEAFEHDKLAHVAENRKAFEIGKRLREESVEGASR